MKKSESIKELATALSKAQSQLRGAHKDSVNPFFKSKYADLESIWEAIRQPLADNDLAITQLTTIVELFTEHTGACIETMLMHKSGEWIMGEFPVMTKDNSAQAMGSGVSYARRYALAAIMGVYQTDDDGEAAQPRTSPAIREAVKNVMPRVAERLTNEGPDPKDKYLEAVNLSRLQGPDPKVKSAVESEYDNNPLAPGGVFNSAPPTDAKGLLTVSEYQSFGTNIQATGKGTHQMTFGPTTPVTPYHNLPAGKRANPSEPQQKRAIAIAKKQGWTGEQFAKCLQDDYKASNIKDLQLKDYNAFVAKLEKTNYAR